MKKAEDSMKAALTQIKELCAVLSSSLINEDSALCVRMIEHICDETISNKTHLRNCDVRPTAIHALCAYKATFPHVELAEDIMLFADWLYSFEETDKKET